MVKFCVSFLDCFVDFEKSNGRWSYVAILLEIVTGIQLHWLLCRQIFNHSWETAKTMKNRRHFLNYNIFDRQEKWVRKKMGAAVLKKTKLVNVFVCLQNARFT